MILKKIQKNNAFTLIELMVATTLFTIVMMMGVGSLVVSSNSAKASQRLRTAVDNVNFAMESMSRELRMGTHYYSNSSNYIMGDDNLVGDYNGGNFIAFNPQVVAGSATKRVAYFKYERIINGNLAGTFSLKRCEFTTSISCSDVVSSDVDIQMLKFYVVGSALPPANKIQPSIKILVKGVVTIKGVATPFTLQTLASQRSTEK